MPGIDVHELPTSLPDPEPTWYAKRFNDRLGDKCTIASLHLLQQLQVSRMTWKLFIVYFKYTNQDSSPSYDRIYSKKEPPWTKIVPSPMTSLTLLRYFFKFTSFSKNNNKHVVMLLFYDSKMSRRWVSFFFSFLKQTVQIICSPGYPVGRGKTKGRRGEENHLKKKGKRKDAKEEFLQDRSGWQIAAG